MTESWTSCDCCGSRQDVAFTEVDDAAMLCVRCRRGLCAECAA